MLAYMRRSLGLPLPGADERDAASFSVASASMASIAFLALIAESRIYAGLYRFHFMRTYIAAARGGDLHVVLRRFFWFSFDDYYRRRRVFIWTHA